ncbi:MAG TPA: SURF1 family protein [Gemmatimonadaceae bacterium]
MRWRTTVFVVLALASAALFVRLGIWQLDRRTQRLARNDLIAARMNDAPIPLAALRGDTAANHYRRIVVAGHPDFDRDIALTLRGNRGSPGVDVLTPVLVSGTDSAILVNRGWVYAADGMTTDLSRWREADSVFTGYVEEFDPTPDSVRLNGIRRANREGIAHVLPYPIRSFYLVALSDSAPKEGRIVRLAIPPLTGGPHLSYAIQWFCFATIAVVGAGVVAARRMRSPTGNGDSP